MRTWNAALAAYVTAQQAAGRSPGTIRLHQHYLAQLRRAHSRDPWAVSAAQLVEFMARPGWAPETRKSARAAVRGFYRWGHGRGLVDDDPAVGLPPVRVPMRPARPTPEHLVRVVARRRDRIGRMAQLAALAGLRVGEIAKVHSSDLAGDELLVHGKGGKRRVVPIVDVDLLLWLQQVDGWAFPNGRGSHLSAGHVSRLLSQAMPGGWTGHTLRHRAASTWFAGTGDLLSISSLLGHSRLETTQRYIKLPDDALRATVRAGAVA